jgi:aminopeptidase N
MKGKKPFHVRGSRRHFLPDREFHTERIKIELKVDPENKSLEGTCSLTITPLRKGLATVHLDAMELRVSKVQLDGSDAQFDYDGERIAVRCGEPLSAEHHTLVVKYSASPRRGVYFVHPDEKYPDKPVQAWTQCEAEGARYWFPCYDHPNDKSTTEMIITAPEGFQTVSNGKLVSQTSSDGWTTSHWSEAAPHSAYLNSFVVAKLVQVDDRAGAVPLEYYVPPEKQKDTMRYFGQTPGMVRIFEEITGFPFPYERYAQVAVHDFIYGGMENISATTLADTRFPDERSEEDYAARYSRPDSDHVGLVAHELAHTWFGDLATLRHWPHAWLNEGFATYMEAVYRERRFGREDFLVNMAYKAEHHFEEDEKKYRRPIVEDDYLYADDLFDTCTYEKASWMIHQLRGLMGDELFFAGMREYLRRFAFKNAETSDLRKAMEDVSGLSLERYFEQSFYRGGYPEFEVEYAWEEASKTASMLVKQAQETDEVTPVFDLPIDLVFYTARGRLVKRVKLSEQSERFQFELDSEPTIVELDPEGWLLKKLKFKKSYALLGNQLSHSVDLLSRESAAADLASFKSPETVELLKAAASKEQHWAVRAEAIRSIGKIGGKEALDAVLTFARAKPRRVRRAAIAALSEFKSEDRLDEALKGALLGDESPFNQCEAALSYGKVKGKDAIELLTEAMKLESPEHGLTEASLEAMGYGKSKEAREIIRGHLAYGHPTRVRVGSLKGYGKLGSLEPEDFDLLKEVALNDKDFVVRVQLLELVADLGDRRFAETLAKVAESDTDFRNRRRALEILEDFASGESDKAIAGLRDEVQKLKEEERGLRDALSRLEHV